MADKIRLLDLFAGVAGLSLGFELVRDSSGNQVFELYRAVEIDKYACETLRTRHGDDKVIEGDLTKPDVHARVIKECKGKVSVVVGGIPCQSFSLIGPRSGYGKKMEQFKEDKRDNLYKEFRKIVEEIVPNVVVIENVKGILSKKDSDNNKIIDKIISDFEELGYNFKNKEEDKYLLLNAADFGVPQKRERVILIGILKKWKNIAVPSIIPTHYAPAAAKPDSDKPLLPYVTLYEAIGDLPAVEAKITKTDLKKKQIISINRKNRKIENGTDKIAYNFNNLEIHKKKITESGKRYFEFIRPNGYKYLDHHIARSQQLSDIKLFGKMKEGETAYDFMVRNPAVAKKLIKYKMKSFKDKYRKQEWNKPSTTVFAHLEKDGNRFIHPEQSRTLTPREAARMQSFPDDFTFSGPINKKFKQIGNAVPPLLAMRIAEVVYNNVMEQKNVK